MENHRITGGGGIQLHVVKTGNSSRRPIMFIHGMLQPAAIHGVTGNHFRGR